MLFFAAFLAGAAAFPSSRFFPILTIFLLTTFFAVSFFLLRRAGQQPLRTLAGCLCSCTAGFLIAHAGQSGASDLRVLEGRTAAFIGVPATDSMLIDSSRNLRAQTFRTGQITTDDGAVRKVRQIRVISQDVFALDREYALSVRMPQQLEFANPGMPRGQIAAFLVTARETGTISMAFLATARGQLHAYFLEHMPSAAGGFLTALVTGERGFIPRELNQAFGATGLAHMLSISGAHFGLVFFVLFHALRFMFLRLPERILSRLTLVIAPSQAAAVLALPAVTLYLGISDLSYPAIRSFLMILLFLLGLLLGRKGMWLNTLLFAACILVAFEPEALTDLSFQLSFAAVLSIGLVSDRLRSERSVLSDASEDGTEQEHAADGAGETLSKRCLKTAGVSVFVSLAATLGTAPLVAQTFHYASLVSPLANLVFTPLIGFLILPWALAGSFCFLLSGFFPFSSLLGSVTELLLGIIETCGRWDWAAFRIQAFPSLMIVLFYGVLTALILVKVMLPSAAGRTETVLQRTDAAVLLLLLAVSFSWGFLQKREGALVTFLDVGQGDAAVVELADNRIIVVDTGRNWQPVASFLRFRGVRTVDALVLSHAHPDHVAGFAGLQRDFRILELWDNGRLSYREPLSPEQVHRTLERGDVIAGNGYTFTALHPYRGYYAAQAASEENNDSLVLKLASFGSSVLFTGDIAVDAEENLLPLGGHLRSTILKVPHHGSRSSLSRPFLVQVAPQFAVISAGRNNRYGHPHPAVLDALAAAHVYRTDRDGAVGVLLHRSGTVSVKTWSQEALQPVQRPEDELLNAKRLAAVW